MGSGDVNRNLVYGESHTERKKYDPLYKIDVKVGTKRVIYIGRVKVSIIHPDLLMVSGVKLEGKVEEELDHNGGEELLLNDGQKVEILYPSNSFIEIKKLTQ